MQAAEVNPPVMDVINCTIVDNEGQYGGGIAFHGVMDESAVMNVRNSIIYGNFSGPGPASLGHEIYFNFQVPGFYIEYSDVQQPGNVYFVNPPIPWGSGNTWGPGNITASPNFVSHYRLPKGSPCVNAGNTVTSFFPGDEYDLDGNMITSELTPDCDLNCRLVTRIDMGAHELQAGPCSADVTGPGNASDHIVNLYDLLAVINALGASCPCLADCAPEPAGDGTVNLGDLVAVINQWGICTTYTGDPIAPLSFETVQDCMDAATSQFTQYSQAWQVFVEDCVAALCAAQKIPCD